MKASSSDGPPAGKMSLRDYVEKYGIRLKKSLGQNLLLDLNLNEKLADAARLTEKDAVVEVGAGLGSLTEVLACRAGRVFAVEIDRSFEPVLNERFAGNPRVAIFMGDVLNHDLAELIETHLGEIPDPLKMVSNLPFYAGSAILMQFLESPAFFDTIVVMMQQEVAERLTATTGTKNYGILTVAAQFFSEIDITGAVSRTCFTPRPKVDAAIVRFRCKRQLPLDGRARQNFFRLVRAAFGKRRKMLRNALAKSTDLDISRDMVETLLDAAGIDSSRRAETLSLDEYLTLTRALTMKKDSE